MALKKTAALLLLAAGFFSLWLFRESSPLARLALSSLGLIWVIKLAAYLWQSSEQRTSVAGTLAYFLAWPGISLVGFHHRAADPHPETGTRFLSAWLTMLAGVALLFALAWAGRGESLPLNYGSLVAIFFVVHLGLMEALADGLRLLGFRPASLFDRPWRASSLQDFWSLRWNRAFVDMNKIFLARPLQGKLPSGVLVFAIFLVSGILHELSISYADAQSWGLPFAYFVIQGFGMLLERRLSFPRALVWAWVLLPLPLLFPPAFVNLFLGGLSQWIVAGLEAIPRDALIRGALAAGGCAHLLVICASVQVPSKLGWKEEFRKLRPLNRKVFWTYGAYIFVIILFQAGVSLLLSRSDLTQAPARAWLLFIALFWWARVLTDTFYFSHADWPEGPLFRIGHVCLTTVFVALAALYAALFLVTTLS